MQLPVSMPRAKASHGFMGGRSERERTGRAESPLSPLLFGEKPGQFRKLLRGRKRKPKALGLRFSLSAHCRSPDDKTPKLLGWLEVTRGCRQPLSRPNP